METDAEMSCVVHDIFRGGKKTSKIIFPELEREREHKPSHIRSKLKVNPERVLRSPGALEQVSINVAHS